MSFFLFFVVFLRASEPGRWINKNEFVNLTDVEVNLDLPGTKRLESRSFSKMEDLTEEIQRIKRASFAASDYTLQQANSEFGKILLRKIKNRAFKKKMREDTKRKKKSWSVRSQKKFTEILKRYFSQVLDTHENFEDALKEIMATARNLNQITDEKPNCFKAKYEGDLKNLFDGENMQKMLPPDTSREKTLDWIKNTFERDIEVFHNDENLFAGPKTLSQIFSETGVEDLNGLEHSGSLDTYITKNTENGFAPLKNLFEFAEKITENDSELVVAERAFLIWKTTGYSTPDHQDVHQPQHIVSYHQLRGEAFFHILPPICGLFLFELYNLEEIELEDKKKKVKNALRFFDKNNVGYYTFLRTDEVIFLPPDKTHFVQVPYEKQNKAIDFVRAFEILFDYEAMAQRTNEEFQAKRKIEEGSKAEMSFEPQEFNILEKSSKSRKKENFQRCNSSDRENSRINGVRWDEGRKRWVVCKWFKIGEDRKSFWGGSFKRDYLEDAKRALDALELKHGKKSDTKLNSPEMYFKTLELCEKEENEQISAEAVEKPPCDQKKNSNYIGVNYYADREQWRARRWSKAEKKNLSNGLYKDEKTAARASDDLARALIANGEHHKMNLPDDKIEGYGKKRTSKFIGVYRDGDRWRANRWSKKDSKNIYNGSYKDEEAAAHASDSLARKLIENGGENCNMRLNFPEVYESVCDSSDREKLKIENAKEYDGKRKREDSENQIEVKETGRMIGVWWSERRERWNVGRSFKTKNKWKKVWGGTYKKDQLEDAKRASDDLVLEYERREGKKCDQKLNYPSQAVLACEDQKIESAERSRAELVLKRENQGKVPINTLYVPKIAFRPHIVEQMKVLLGQMHYNYFDALWDYYSDCGLDNSEIQYAMDIYSGKENSIYEQVAERPMYAFQEAQAVKKNYHLPLVPLVSMLCENGITREETFIVLRDLLKTDTGVLLDQEKMKSLWTSQKDGKN